MAISQGFLGVQPAILGPLKSMIPFGSWIEDKWGWVGLRDTVPSCKEEMTLPLMALAMTLMNGWGAAAPLRVQPMLTLFLALPPPGQADVCRVPPRHVW